MKMSMSVCLSVCLPAYLKNHISSEAVVDVEVVREARPVLAVLDLPLGRTEAADEEQDETDADVRQHDTDPDVEVERVHEREDSRLLFLRLLDHDAC